MNHITAALLMIALVLSLPFVSAVHISSVVGYGEQEIPGIISKNDSITIDVFIDTSDNAAATPQAIFDSGIVSILGTNNFSAESCRAGTGSEVICSQKFNLSYNLGETVFEYGAQLTGQPALYDFLFLDDVAPPFEDIAFSVTQNGTEVVYFVSAKDEASFGVGRCSGLWFFNITNDALETQDGADANESETVVTSTTVLESGFDGTCEDAVTSSFPVGSLDGLQTFCIAISDRFGSTTSKCASLVIDSSAPEIISADLLTRGGVPAAYVSPEGSPLKIAITTFDAGAIVTASSEAYVTLIRNNQIATNPVGLSCSYTQFLEGRNYSCVTDVFDAEAGDILLDLTLLDEAGNTAFLNKTFTVATDDVGPQLSAINGELMSGDTFYVSDMARFDMQFVEEGMGLHTEEVYAIFNGLTFKAESCTPGWSCSFEIPTASMVDGTYYLAVHPQTKDDAGNFLKNASEAPVLTVVVDHTAPIITVGSVEGVNEFGRFEFASGGGRVLTNYTVSDASPFTSQVNFSLLKIPEGVSIGNDTGSYNVIDASCTGALCDAASDPIGAGGYTHNVLFMATDILGNEVVVPYALKVLSVSNESDHWDGAFSASPAAFDREVATLLNQKSHAQIILTSDVPMTIISANFAECVSPVNATEGLGGREYLSSFDFLSSSEDQTEHYFYVESKTTDYFINAIELECRFEIASYSADELVPSEIEIVTARVGLYNNPADMPDEAFEKKLDDAVAEAGDFLKSADDIYAWFRWAEKICQIYSTVVGLIAAIGTIVGFLGVTEKTLDAIPIVGTIAARGVQASKAGVCTSGHATRQSVEKTGATFIEPLCSWVSCDISILNMLNQYGAIDRNPQLVGARQMLEGGLPGDGKSVDAQGDPNFDKGISPNVLDAHGISVVSSDSIVWQIMSFCVPGVLKKVHEWRAIKCSYVNCLIDNVEGGLLNEAACESIRADLECNYIFGELFSLIPFAGFIDAIFDFFATFSEDYISGTLQVVTWGCLATCAQPGPYSGFCDIVVRYTNLANSIAKVVDIADNAGTYFSFDDNMNACEDMDDKLGELAKKDLEFADRVRERTNFGENGNGAVSYGTQVEGGADGTTPAYPDSGLEGSSGTSSGGTQTSNAVSSYADSTLPPSSGSSSGASSNAVKPFPDSTLDSEASS